MLIFKCKGCSEIVQCRNAHGFMPKGYYCDECLTKGIKHKKRVDKFIDWEKRHAYRANGGEI